MISFESFKDKHVLVVGDIMLDEYVWGSTSRVSPEAPVIIVKESDRTYSLGGAGNVAMNLQMLGAGVSLACVAGGKNGYSCQRLFNILHANRINCGGVYLSTKRYTTVKTRIMANGRQVLRVDEEDTEPISETVQGCICSMITNNFDAVIVSDYNKGVITADIVCKINALEIPVFVDSKTSAVYEFDNPNIIYTPNDDEYKTYFKYIDIDIVPERVLHTKGAEGMVVIESGKETVIPSEARQVFDVSGAGDTVIATLCMCMISGGSFEESARVANKAAGIVVGKVGTVPITYEELRREL